SEREAIFRACRRRGVLVNVMDDPARCDFAAPAVVRRGDLTIAVSTSGRSPALARRLREELEHRFGDEWAEILDVVGDVRDEINRLLVDRARQGRTVVRLKGGDPFVFGRGGEECLALEEAGIPYEVIPGVSSVVAAPAYAGIPLTHRGLGSSFAVVTASLAN